MKRQKFIYRVSLRNFCTQVQSSDDIDEVLEEIGKEILKPNGLNESHILSIDKRIDEKKVFPK